MLQEGPFTVARWRPVLAPEHRDALAYAASIAPAICRNGSVTSTDDVLAAITDGLARAVLHHGGWRPDLGRKRALEVQAIRGVFAALAKPDPVIRSGTDDFEDAVADIGRALERHRRRLDGEPVVRGRVRLTLPDDALDPWLVELELVDDADPGNWCTADDVWERGARAVAVAGSARHGSPRSQTEVLALAALVAPHVPGLAELATEHEPGTVELDIEQADDFLDSAPHELRAARHRAARPRAPREGARSACAARPARPRPTTARAGSARRRSSSGRRSSTTRRCPTPTSPASRPPARH